MTPELAASLEALARHACVASGAEGEEWHSGGSTDPLLDALQVLETAARHIEVAMSVVAAEVSRCEVHGGRSAGSAATRMGSRLGVPAARVRGLVEAGSRTGSPGMSALRAGHITAQQERTIAERSEELPATAGPERRAAFEAELLEVARTGAGSRVLGRHADARLAEWYPDREDVREELQARRRSGRAHCPAVDGTSLVALTCTPELRAMIDAFLVRFAVPGRCIAAPPDPETGQVPDLVALAAQDRRSYEQRVHDAFRHAFALALDAGPAAPRGVATIVVRLSAEQVDQVVDGRSGGLVVTDAGSELSARQAIAMAEGRSWFVSALRRGREELRRIDVDGPPGTRPGFRPRPGQRRGSPEPGGGPDPRGPRLASVIQRLVLFTAHGGCTHPGCHVAAAACHAHHVREYSRGGPTTVANLTLACPIHHGWVGDGADSWRTVADPARPGRPHWRAPGHTEGRSTGQAA